VFREGDIRSTAAPDFNEKRLREVDEIRRTEVPRGANMAQWALAWCLAQPALTGVIVGCKNISQLEMNAAAIDINIKRR
jgi:aryl-alcohol dehydrogenase-like predicted oxidoreductase